MQGAIAILLVLGGLIFFHELGHFLAARSLGIGVKAFSIGFGPAIFSWKGKKTKYQISAVPLGGYVSMVGETDAADIPAPFTPEDSFANHKAWQRLIVVASGPIFNLILAWLLFIGLFWLGNIFPLAEIDRVMPDSPAQRAGLAYGDIVKSINGEETPTWGKMYAAIQALSAPKTAAETDDQKEDEAKEPGQPLVLEVERGNRILTFTITPEHITDRLEDGTSFTNWRIGITPTGRTQNFTFTQAIRRGLEETWRTTKLIGHFVGRLFRGEGSVKDIGGPVLVAQMVQQQANRGLSDVLFLTAFLSINLGLLNLMPIPALDGGHVLFCLLEVVFRRPVPQKIQTVCIYAGFGLLIILMVMATAFDIFRIMQ
ncbi:MAG: site-2 protease family protein [Deltaproteobacteria bacterium]|jgi:regulator of sigma E protease|nr:site-2 protease family protein [Deltaproteobacteria bacterium]